MVASEKQVGQVVLDRRRPSQSLTTALDNDPSPPMQMRAKIQDSHVSGVRATNLSGPCTITRSCCRAKE